MYDLCIAEATASSYGLFVLRHSLFFPFVFHGVLYHRASSFFGFVGYTFLLGLHLGHFVALASTTTSLCSSMAGEASVVLFHWYLYCILSFSFPFPNHHTTHDIRTAFLATSSNESDSHKRLIIPSSLQPKVREPTHITNQAPSLWLFNE